MIYESIGNYWNTSIYVYTAYLGLSVNRPFIVVVLKRCFAFTFRKKYTWHTCTHCIHKSVCIGTCNNGFISYLTRCAFVIAMQSSFTLRNAVFSFCDESSLVFYFIWNMSCSVAFSVAIERVCSMFSVWKVFFRFFRIGKFDVSFIWFRFFSHIYFF